MVTFISLLPNSTPNRPSLPPSLLNAPLQPWGTVIGACLIVNIMTFCGVCLIAFGVGKPSPMLHGIFSGGASGALLACAVFLILAEGLYLIGTGEDYEEVDIVWRWGTAFLGGFLTALFLKLAEPIDLATLIVTGSSSVPSDEKSQEMPETSVDKPVDEDQIVIDDRTTTALFAICVGDFMHNLVDGFAIGFAFKMCDTSVAWGILGGTVWHEFAQEIGDFALLHHDVGLSIVQALAWNFLAGTSVIIGGIIATAVDVSDVSTGVLLAYGGGTYVYLATAEALPRALAYADQLEDHSFMSTKKHYAAVFAAFFFGALMIGLVLIEHEHCVPDGGEHAH